MPSLAGLSMSDKILSIFIAFYILAIVTLRFSGIPDQYDVLFTFFDGPEFFPKDIYLNNTFFFESSYYFSINKILGLHRNELISFAYYLVLSVIAIIYSYRIIQKHFGVDDPLVALFVLSFVCVLGRDIPINTWGGIIAIQPGTATMFAKTLGIMAVYYLLENRVWICSALITLTISLHILGDIILPAILFFYIFLNRAINNSKLVVLFLPVLFILYKKFTAGVDVSGGDGVETMFEAIMSYGRHDGDFLAQSKPALAMLVASFLVFPLLWKRFATKSKQTNSLAIVLKAIYVASLLVFIGSVFYMTIGYKLFLFPPLIMLAPVRAMNYYTLFFYLSVFVLTVQTTRLATLEKVSILLSLVLLHGESIRGFIYPAVVLTGGFVVSRYGGQITKNLGSSRALVITGMIALIGLTSLQVVRGGKYQTSFSSLGWQHIKRWRPTIDGGPEVWNVYDKIRNMPTDFVMLPLTITDEGRVRTSTYMNIFARKSHFISDGHHFYFNAKLWNEFLIRKDAYKDLIASLKDGNMLGEQTIEILRSRNVSVVAPAKFEKYLVGWQKKEAIDGFYILRYGG